MTRLIAFMNTLRFKLFATLLLIIIPLIFMLILNALSSVKVVRSQVSQSNKHMLSLYMNQMDLLLQEVDKFLFNLSEMESDIIIFDAERQRNETNYTLAKIRLNQKLYKEMPNFSTIDLLFVYSNRNQELIMTEGFGNSYGEREKVKLAILKMIHKVGSEINYAKWNVWQEQDKNYIFHLIRTGETFVGAWVESDKLLQPLRLSDHNEAGIVLLTNADNEPITSQLMIDDDQINYEYSQDSFTLTGNKKSWFLIGEPAKSGFFNILVLMPDKVILQQLPFLQQLTTIILIAVIIFLLFFFYFMQKIFLNPIKKIVIAMRKLRDGNWDMRIESQKTSTEFEIMNETFNQMISEIGNLKINVYEEKINHQRAELKHLQLQINPHFFMNSLNIIYNLATLKDYKLVQEMTRCLVTYFRFMFKSNSYFVSLRDELSHTSNYLRIQQLRFPTSLNYYVEGSEETMEIEVPPLIVQSMVENTVKYGVNPDEPISIFVTAYLQKDADHSVLIIDIKDTGSGFPEHILDKLNSDLTEHDGSGEKIGIWNVRRRLKLLYDDQATIQFYNDKQYGAAVKFKIKLK